MLPVLTLLLGASPLAIAAQVSLQLDTPVLSEGQSVGLVLTVTDTSVRNGPPRFAVPEGLQAAFESQKQQQLMLNYNLTTSTMYRYTLTALKAGEYTIPAVSVQTAAGALQTGPVSVRVQPRGASAAGVNELTGELSDAVRWVGQEVVYHLRFATDRPIQNGNWVAPEGKGFVVDPAIEHVITNGTLGDGDTRLVVRDLYLPLRFTEPGRITIPGGALQAQFPVERARRRRGQLEQLFPEMGMLMEMRSDVFSAETLTRDIKDPPKAGRPPEWSGLVGTFQLTSHVNGAPSTGPMHVNVGDTITIAVDLVGSAPVSGVKLPPLVGDGFKVYDDQPVATGVIRDGKIVATSSFKRAVVPERPGPLTIPAISLPTFDPATGSYLVLRTEPLELDVQGSAATANVASFSSGAAPVVDAGATDELLPVRTNPSLSPPWPGKWALLLLLPGVLALAGSGVKAAVARRAAVVPGARALGFADLPDDPHERLSGLEQIFRESVAPGLGIGAAAVRGEDLARLGALADEAQAVYRLLERARYADAGGAERKAVEDLEAALRAFVRRLT